jgi:DNA polymerase-4
MDAFFVSVEELYDPALRGLPVIVGGALEGRGVVTSASYEARRFGVRSAMPISRARRLCPQAVFLRGDFERYREASRRVFRCFEPYTPLIEPLGIDEAYLDLTGCERLLGHPMASAARLQREILRQAGLACSIGVASSRLVAKVASALAKPKGVLRVVPGAEASFLAPLALGRLPGVGPATVEELRALGLRTVGQLASVSRDLLVGAFGPAAGEGLWRRAQGLDSSTSGGPPPELPKSVGRERTFAEDVLDRGFLEAVLSALVQRSATAMRSLGLEARTVVVKLRYSDFATATRRATLAQATGEEARLEAEAVGLLRALDVRRMRVRLVGVTLSGLGPARRQLDLFDPARPRRWALAEGVDGVRARYGAGSVVSGRAISLLSPRLEEDPLAPPSGGVGAPGERFGRTPSEEPAGFGPPAR